MGIMPGHLYIGIWGPRAAKKSGGPPYFHYAGIVQHRSFIADRRKFSNELFLKCRRCVVTVDSSGCRRCVVTVDSSAQISSVVAFFEFMVFSCHLWFC